MNLNKSKEEITDMFYKRLIHILEKKYDIKIEIEESKVNKNENENGRNNIQTFS